jgi:HK97 family phage prohead protease
MKMTGFGEIRAAANSEMTLEGRAIVFDTPTVLFESGGIKYSEIINSNALDRADISDVVLRYNHSGEMTVLARTRNRSLQLEKRPDGLYIRANLQQDIQQHKDIYNAVRSGLIDKMSFGFIIADDGDRYDPKTHTRTINNIRKLFDCSLVDQPAYEQTFVEARSKAENFEGIETYRQSLILRTKLLKARI